MEEKKMNIFEKLVNIQNELKAPKNNYNDFGKYNYRSCEDILEAVKPLCLRYKVALTISDDVVAVSEKKFIRASVYMYDTENPSDIIENYAYAEIATEKKGMDVSQITGTASSYARKYALNGLFCIDDTKDADTNEYQKQTKQEIKKDSVKKKEVIKTKANITDIDKPMNFGKYKDKTWIEVYSEDIRYLEELVSDCKSEEGKKVYTALIKKIADSFITVPDKEIEDIFSMNGDVTNE